MWIELKLVTRNSFGNFFVSNVVMCNEDITFAIFLYEPQPKTDIYPARSFAFRYEACIERHCPFAR